MNDNDIAPEFSPQIDDHAILCWHDRPILYHAHDHLGRYWLAYFFGMSENRRLDRFLFVPTTQGVIEDLAARRTTLHAALTEQSAFGWTALEAPSGHFMGFERVNLSEISPGSLPKVGTFL